MEFPYFIICGISIRKAAKTSLAERCPPNQSLLNYFQHHLKMDHCQVNITLSLTNQAVNEKNEHDPTFIYTWSVLSKKGLKISPSGFHALCVAAHSGFY